MTFKADDRVWYTFDSNRADTGTVRVVTPSKAFVTWDDGRYDTVEVVNGVIGEWFGNSELALVES